MAHFGADLQISKNTKIQIGPLLKNSTFSTLETFFQSKKRALKTLNTREVEGL